MLGGRPFTILIDWLQEPVSSKTLKWKKTNQKRRKVKDIEEGGKKGGRKEASQVGGKELFLPTGNTSFKVRVPDPEVLVGFCVWTTSKFHCTAVLIGVIYKKNWFTSMSTKPSIMWPRTSCQLWQVALDLESQRSGSWGRSLPELCSVFQASLEPCLKYQN